METLAAKAARHAFVAARLDADGRIVEACQHRHGRAYSDAIACARTHGWDGFAELLVDAAQPVQPLDVWLFDQWGGDAPLPVGRHHRRRRRLDATAQLT